MKIELKILNKKFYSDGNTNGFTPEGYPQIPSYATQGSAAIDLVCTSDVLIKPGEVKFIPTGIALHIGSAKSSTNDWNDPESIAGIILPRSGLGTKGLVLANTIGLIDEDYQGEIIVAAWNRNKTLEFSKTDLKHDSYLDMIKIKAGDRFAQLMFIPVIKAQFNIVEEFSAKTERNEGGFGSTDK